jgi:7-cyano-7-deazaguanine synthase
MKKAIVLFSGGLDSTTTLYYAISKGYKCYALSFDYGQKHVKELKTAKKIADAVNVALRVVKVTLPWDQSALINKKIKIPFTNPVSSKKIPSTYVPGRNTIFISYALSYAETIKADVIFTGANALDFSNYPDCRPKYFKAFNTVTNALGVKIKIISPLINMTKAQIVKLAVKLGAPYKSTWSCYSGGKKPCLKCDSCKLRAKGFKDAGVCDS